MTILFTVTNDLTYDQRMHRICGTLAAQGHHVVLIGRKRSGSIPLGDKPFQQKRLNCHFQKGFPFYAEYNFRLFLHLLFARYDAVCSVDLDTLPAGCLASLIRRKKRVFDAHEYFTEVPEVVNRPFVKAFWGSMARIFLPFYKHAYTVGPALAKIFSEKHHVPFEVVRNVPEPHDAPANIPATQGAVKTIFYQGALNEGRGIEAMLEAMPRLDNVRLLIAGEGDLSALLRKKALDLRLGSRVEFLGFVKPEALKSMTAHAWLGLNLLENKGLSYYYSLANKFFDCVQAEVPILTMNFPEYQALNAQHEVALLIDDLKSQTIVDAVRALLANPLEHSRLRENCRKARAEWNWEREQAILLALWKKVEAAA